jgi:Bcr/CflA subfamily drug resistance transporter
MYNKSIGQVLLILSPSIVLGALAMDIIIPCIPAIATGFGVSFSISQWVSNIFFLGTGLGQVIMGPLADHYGRRKVILGAILLFGLSSIACAYVTSVHMLILCRLSQGIGACGATVVALTVIRDLFDDNTTPRAYSYVNSITAAAPILAPLIGGSMLVHTGTWRTCFYFVTVFGMLAFSVNYFSLTETNPRFVKNNTMKPQNVINDYKEILSNNEFLCFTYAGVAALSALFLFFSVSPILMIHILKIPANVYGFYFGCNFLVYLSGNVSSAKIEAKFGMIKVIQLGNCLIVTGALTMLWWHMLYGLSIAALMVPTLIITYGVGLIYGPCMAGAMRQFKHIAGTASASYGALLYCSSALIVAAIMQTKVNSTVPFAIAMTIMGSLSLLVIKTRVDICKT